MDSVQHLADSVPEFSEIISTYGLPSIPHRAPGFASLVLIILEQQVSLDSARATFEKLRASIGLEPENIASSSFDDLRACGISRQKVSYITGIANAVIGGSLDFESHLQKTPDEIRHELVSLKGIGHWTAGVYLMFCLGAPDEFPANDIGLIKSVEELFGPEANIVSLSEQWKPYRSTAAFLLWHQYLKKRGRRLPG